ncbi:hypothetical protein N7462_007987 [Penicillium macrosclerotiorum]|uniref:uncharacterized protein n=1 Tax=Penicillium macrosclerotiorum TaxID=303699 RepID=UPI0025487DCB|nr:uncharacterized protein N7462_007987 [Penicillium macrosclerotiorum]KAJ5679743.1 hypothetical protein N7462_007987 [Penicillium macrosclerotiorum]
MVRFITDSRAPPMQKSPLLVIGAGLPRTATSSLQAALEELGFDPCLHMAHIIPHTNRMQILLDAARETDIIIRQKLIHQLLDGYAAVCDMPAVFFLDDLLDMFPDAVIILSGRTQPETWAKSCSESLGFFFTRRFYWTCFLWKTDRQWFRLNMRILDWCKEKLGETQIFSGNMYDKYNDSVRATAKHHGRDILEFKAEDGWEPLCEYLGKDVPNKEFPKVNEKGTFAMIKRIMIIKGLLSWAALGGAVWVGWRYGLAWVR